jgi:drug/metabolite transporter (DMT)-like permease
VTTTALSLALGAACLHAFWNLVLARARDVQAATAVTLGLAVVLFAPVAALTWDVDPDVWPYALGSAAFELAYIVLLAYAYERAELSVVYPISRGLAPVVVLLLTLPASGTEIAGVGLVAAGVLFVRGVRDPERRGLGLGVAIACCIAAYTLFDSRGTDYASPFAYLELVLVVPAAAYLVWILRRRGREAIRAELGLPTVLAALTSFGAYALVLLALREAPAASVAAVRETSVVIAVALAAIVLHERVGAGRLAGAAAVVGGIGLLSL